MGLLSNYPLALAPGMGHERLLHLHRREGHGDPLADRPGCVFLSGCAFALLTLVGVRKVIINALPRSLFAAVGGGIGLFIAFIGLKDAGIIVADPGTTVGLGHLTTPTAAVSLLGLLIIAALQSRGIRGYMLIGILITAVVAWSVGLAHFTPGHFSLHDLGGNRIQARHTGSAEPQGRCRAVGG
ncbi:MAG: solute carrier family 23 protein [Steroidobacteraceae bacterium]